MNEDSESVLCMFCYTPVDMIKEGVVVRISKITDPHHYQELWAHPACLRQKVSSQVPLSEEVLDPLE
jgi:hypothetical protein